MCHGYFAKMGIVLDSRHRTPVVLGGWERCPRLAEEKSISRLRRGLGLAYWKASLEGFVGFVFSSLMPPRENKRKSTPK